MQILHLQAKNFRVIFKHVQILQLSSEKYIFCNLETALKLSKISKTPISYCQMVITVPVQSLYMT